MNHDHFYRCLESSRSDHWFNRKICMYVSENEFRMAYVVKDGWSRSQNSAYDWKYFRDFGKHIFLPYKMWCESKPKFSSTIQWNIRTWKYPVLINLTVYFQYLRAVSFQPLGPYILWPTLFIEHFILKNCSFEAETF